MQLGALNQNAAGNLIIEDHIKKTLCKKGKGKYNDPKKSKLVPRMNHSAFGDFPKDFHVGKKSNLP